MNDNDSGKKDVEESGEQKEKVAVTKLKHGLAQRSMAESCASISVLTTFAVVRGCTFFQLSFRV